MDASMEARKCRQSELALCRLIRSLSPWCDDQSVVQLLSYCTFVSRACHVATVDKLRTLHSDLLRKRLPFLRDASQVLQRHFVRAMVSCPCLEADKWANGLTVHSQSITSCSQRFTAWDFWDEACAVLSLAVPASERVLTLKLRFGRRYNSGERGIGYEEFGPMAHVSSLTVDGYSYCSLGLPLPRCTENSCCHCQGHNCSVGPTSFHTWIINVNKTLVLEHVATVEKQRKNDWMSEMTMDDEVRIAPWTDEHETDLRDFENRHARQMELNALFKQTIGRAISHARKKNPEDMLDIWEEWRSIDFNRQRFADLQRSRAEYYHRFFLHDKRQSQRKRLIQMLGCDDAPYIIRALALAYQAAVTERVDSALADTRASICPEIEFISEEEAEQRHQALSVWLEAQCDLCPQAPGNAQDYLDMIRSRAFRLESLRREEIEEMPIEDEFALDPFGDL
eukprot:TRINITY_DN15230_c0_g1_i1.p1 TRINITY_DN15230_c0_g1~~TRINITY_DN15230_c0_g1_i1.p1  ORF type:complete len:452 (-),score=42.97 TRINITY_DN15230_c0_g1_i1:285-1640(-)